MRPFSCSCFFGRKYGKVPLSVALGDRGASTSSEKNMLRIYKCLKVHHNGRRRVMEGAKT